MMKDEKNRRYYQKHKIVTREQERERERESESESESKSKSKKIS